MANKYPGGNLNYINFLSNSGGGSGATSLVVTSEDSTVIQNGSSSYDSGTQTLTVDLSAVGSGGGVTPLEIQSQEFVYAADTGTVNNYVIAVTPTIISLVAGMQFSALIANTNTSSNVFLTVDGTGAKNIILTDQNPVAIGDLVEDGISYFVYDGANFQLLNPAASGTVTPATIQNQSFVYAVDTGTDGSAIVINPTPPIAGLVDGMAFEVLMNNSLISPATLTVNGFSALIVGADTNSVPSGAVTADGVFRFVYNQATGFFFVETSLFSNTLLRQIQSNSFIYAGDDTGTANDYIVSLNPYNLPSGIHASVLFVPAHNNTGASTITIDGVGTATIKMNDGTDTPAGALLAGNVYEIIGVGLPFDHWQLVNPATSLALSTHPAAIGYNQLTDSPSSATYAHSAYGNGVFVVCDDTSVLSYTLNNGKTWIAGVFPGGMGAPLAGIIYGNGVWVAVATNGNYIYTTDFITWQSNYPNTGITSINDIAFGDGYFVVVGNGGQSSVSADGDHWIPVSLPTTDDYNNVCFADFYGYGNLFMAVSLTSGNTATSLGNNFNWQLSSSLPITSYTSAKLCASPTVLLLIDTSGSATTSYMYFDAFGTWTDGSSNPLPSSEVWTGAAYDPINRVFFLFTQDGASTVAAQGVLSAPDSITYTLTWTAITQPQAAKWLTPVYGNFGFMGNNTLSSNNAYFAFWSFAPQVAGEAGNNQIVTQNDLSIGLNYFENKLAGEIAAPEVQLVSLMNDLSYTADTNQILLFDAIVGSGILNLYNSVTGVFTVPYSGIYSIQFSGLATLATIANVRLIAVATGAPVAYCIPWDNQGGTNTVSINTTLSFPEGGTFQFQFDSTGSGSWFAGAGALNLYTTNVTVTFIGGR